MSDRCARVTVEVAERRQEGGQVFEPMAGSRLLVQCSHFVSEQMKREPRNRGSFSTALQSDRRLIDLARRHPANALELLAHAELCHGDSG